LTDLDAEAIVLRLLESQSRIEALKIEENRLNSLLLAEQQRANDLVAQRLAFDRQVENRRTGQYNELMNRLTTEIEQNRELVGKLVTTDDAFNDTINWLNDSLKDILHNSLKGILMALWALLSRNKNDIAESAVVIRTRFELIQRQGNLSRLQERAAKHGSLNVPTHLANEIDEEKQRIEELTSQLNE